MTDGRKKPEKLTRLKKPGQFEPGRSGNRGGRLAKKPMGVGEHALAVLQQNVRTTLNGKEDWYSLAEVLGTSIVHDAIKGCKHSREMLIDFQSKFAPPPEFDSFGFPWP